MVSGILGFIAPHTPRIGIHMLVGCLVDGAAGRILSLCHVQHLALAEGLILIKAALQMPLVPSALKDYGGLRVVKLAMGCVFQARECGSHVLKSSSEVSALRVGKSRHCELERKRRDQAGLGLYWVSVKPARKKKAWKITCNECQQSKAGKDAEPKKPPHPFLMVFEAWSPPVLFKSFGLAHSGVSCAGFLSYW